MARTDTLGHFLTDVADAIRTKKGSQETIQASSFDTEITNLPSGGDLSEYFNTTINSNNYRASNDYVKKVPDFVITSDVTSLYQVFVGFNPILVSEIVVTGDSSNVTTIGRAFYQAVIQKKVVLKNLDLSNVENFNSMFYQNTMNRYGPTEVVLNITTSNKITQIQDLFYNCSYLNTITGLNNINASNCTIFSQIFYNCRSLASIDISSWEPTQQFSINNLFYNCTGLSHIDIRKFTLTNTTSSSGWLTGVPTNCEIIVKDQTQKDWMTTYHPDYTNVKTVAEYENE